MKELLRILLIENNLADAHLIRYHLQNSSSISFEIEHETTLHEGMKYLKVKQIDIVLIDLNLPDIAGIDAFLKLQTNFEEIPMIVLSGVHDEKTATLAVKRGAQDYIAKTQMNSYILSRSIKYAIERKKMEQEILRTQKSEMIGLLAGGIAHDFNNILTSILGNISLIKLDITPEENLEHYHLLEEAEEAVLRAKNLANQLLTFSKGGAPIKKPAFLFQIIQESAEFALRGSNVRCILELDPNLWMALIDKGQIQQVLHNIIINANQSMPDGGELIIEAKNTHITLESQLPIKAGKYIQIDIIDSGRGIPKEMLPKIFDPYFTTKTSSSGLGLTSSYSIIKRHEGYITVKSEINKGTAVSIYLPAIIPKKSSEKRNEINLTGTLKPNIIIMDDEAGVRNILSRMLKKFHNEVFSTSNGEELIAKYEELIENNKSVDLVIMDLTIPGGMGGKEAMKILKDRYPKIRAIVSSGYSNDPVMANYKRYGFLGFLKKPFTIHDLQNVLKKHLT